MSFSSKSDYFVLKGTMMIWDREKKVARPATCADCALSKAYTIYDEWELRKHLENKVRCLLQNCKKEPDDLACADFERVR